MTITRSTARRSAAVGARGFSLLELLIAIAILLAISATAVVILMPKKAQADVDLTKADLGSFKSALKFFKLDMGRYPSEDEGLAVLWIATDLEEEEDEAKWGGPYLEAQPKDRWDAEWIYTYPSEDVPGMYEIVSMGPDGEEETDDDISSLDSMRDEDGEIDEVYENAFDEESPDT